MTRGRRCDVVLEIHDARVSFYNDANSIRYIYISGATHKRH